MKPSAVAVPADPLLSEFFPIKPIGAFLSVDFVAGCSFGCRFCISRRHPAREALFAAAQVIDLGLSPRQLLAWLESMPSYRAGVQLRIGHDSDAGLQFEKASQLVDALPADRSVIWLSRKPLGACERAFFSKPRPNLLLKLTATPRSHSLGVVVDPMALVDSAAVLSPEQLFWVVGPLAWDSEQDAARVLDALPSGSHVHLKPVNLAGLAALAEVEPIGAEALARLEARAGRRGLVVTEWFCRRSVAPLGRGFFDVDLIASQPPGAKRDRELAVCLDCPSRALCHAPVDEAALGRRIEKALVDLGLTPLSPPRRTASRTFEVKVAEPSSRGDETWLAHALGEPVRVRLSTREPGASQGGAFCNVDEAVLRRWAARGFLPVDELARAAQATLRKVRAIAAVPEAPAVSCGCATARQPCGGER